MIICPKNTLILQVNNAQVSAENFWKEINERYEQLRHDIERPILAPKQLYVEVDALFTRLKEFPKILLQQAPQHLWIFIILLLKTFLIYRLIISLNTLYNI